MANSVIGDRQVYNRDEGLCTYLYERVRRTRIIDGTRAASVTLHLPGLQDQGLALAARSNVASKAVDVAAILWQQRWGELPWAQAVLSVEHGAQQVRVELRVAPLPKVKAVRAIEEAT
jgi:hypothetical protein